MSNYPNLLKPIKIRNKVFRNRIFSAPITPFFYTNEHSRPADGLIEHYASKARGGVGCITISGVALEPHMTSEGEVGMIDLFHYFNQRDVARLIDRVHSYGSGLSVELCTHGHGYTVSGGQITGAAFEAHRPSRGEMPEDVMNQIADEFAAAAKQVKELGFDMVMVHFGHGCVISQFLSPFWNKRTDKYGGSLENRARFPLMILERMRQAVGDFPIEMRFTGDEKRPGGTTLEQSVEFIRLAQEYIDIAHVATGGLSIHVDELLYPSTQMPSDYMPPHCNIIGASTIKHAEGIRIPVTTIGGLQDLDEAEEILAGGHADIIYMARGLIADPELANKAYAGKPEDVNPCIKCYHCVDALLRFNCTVNPKVGEEMYRVYEEPAKVLKKVAVVGGGPAGLKAAATAAQRGHDVTLFEREGKLGGRLAFADKMEFKRGVKKLKNYLIRQAEQSGVKFRLNTEVTGDLLKAEGFEHAILAIGARTVPLPVKGLEGNCIYAADIYEKDMEPGKRVAIIGGGLSGCETAVYLARKGHEVTIIEATGDLCGGMRFGTNTLEYYRVVVGNLREEKNVKIYLNAKCTEAGKDFVEVQTEEGTVRVDVDSIVVSVGMKARTDEALAMWPVGIPVEMAGDCIKAADIEQAIRTGYHTALNVGRS